jgi:hypothetical protein
MNTDTDRVFAALRQPEALSSLTLSQWDLLVRQARRAGLLARLCILLDENGLLEGVPAQARVHLESDRTLAWKFDRDVRWEARCICSDLEKTGIPIILLKGAAYVIAGLPSAKGRMFSDIDIMVPKSGIGETEKALRGKGWFFGSKLSAYDQEYYRRWMHEIPPLRHMIRGTTLDVHHTIVPETARSDVNARKLRESAIPVEGFKNLWILAPADMVLHSAVHLFNEGEFAHGLRDLSDLDLLMRHFSDTPSFWSELTGRALEFGLERPLFYALRHCKGILGTTVPETAFEALSEDKVGPLTGAVVDRLFRVALRPHHHTCQGPFSGFALWLLYVRAHHLRMPAYLLVPHLVRKAIASRRKD